MSGITVKAFQATAKLDGIIDDETGYLRTYPEIVDAHINTTCSGLDIILDHELNKDPSKKVSIQITATSDRIVVKVFASDEQRNARPLPNPKMGFNFNFKTNEVRLFPHKEKEDE